MDLFLGLANVPLSAEMSPQLLYPLVEVFTGAIERFGGELAGRDSIISYEFVHIVSQGPYRDGRLLRGIRNHANAGKFQPRELEHIICNLAVNADELLLGRYLDRVSTDPDHSRSVSSEDHLSKPRP